MNVLCCRVYKGGSSTPGTVLSAGLPTAWRVSDACCHSSLWRTSGCTVKGGISEKMDCSCREKVRRGHRRQRGLGRGLHRRDLQPRSWSQGLCTQGSRRDTCVDLAGSAGTGDSDTGSSQGLWRGTRTSHLFSGLFWGRCSRCRSPGERGQDFAVYASVPY